MFVYVACRPIHSTRKRMYIAYDKDTRPWAPKTITAGYCVVTVGNKTKTQ